MTPAETGAVLATLALQLHRTPAPAALPYLGDWLAANFQDTGERIPAPVARGLLSLIDGLPAGDTLCHGDLHPGNVIMTAQGPGLIDWFGAVRAPAAYDLGLCEILLSEIVADRVADPERPRAVFAALKSEYARLAGLTPEALTAAAAPFLPMGCGLVLLAGVSPTEQARLIRRIEDALGARDGLASD
jgi:Ser/Thr protein kinase RdoA (MazF antagonist)